MTPFFVKDPGGVNEDLKISVFGYYNERSTRGTGEFVDVKSTKERVKNWSKGDAAENENGFGGESGGANGSLKNKKSTDANNNKYETETISTEMKESKYETVFTFVVKVSIFFNGPLDSFKAPKSRDVEISIPGTFTTRAAVTTSAPLK